ncbi:hypothetical protein DFJ73DRAFT_946438 [Zopfochytrium polystomum]|nr:hypothetical protein DFJ73DRAFT_946438 [Zopfochytrium polystomum]
MNFQTILRKSRQFRRMAAPRQLISSILRSEQARERRLTAVLAFVHADDSDSDQGWDQNRRRGGGSRPGKQQNISREFSKFYKQLVDDYFSETPRYGEEMFKN